MRWFLIEVAPEHAKQLQANEIPSDPDPWVGRMFHSPKHCPCRGDETVHRRRGDVSPLPRVPAGRFGHGQPADPSVHQSEESDGAPRRQNHRAQLHSWNVRLLVERLHGLEFTTGCAVCERSPRKTRMVVGYFFCDARDNHVNMPSYLRSSVPIRHVGRCLNRRSMRVSFTILAHGEEWARLPRQSPRPRTGCLWWSARGSSVFTRGPGESDRWV